jgi:hypothetical protein
MKTCSKYMYRSGEANWWSISTALNTVSAAA